MSRWLTKFGLGMVAVLGLSCALGGVGQAAEVPEDGAKSVPSVSEVSPLDDGFSGLYNLDFSGAQKDFTVWQTEHPDDPMGPVSEA